MKREASTGGLCLHGQGQGDFTKGQQEGPLFPTSIAIKMVLEFDTTTQL